MRIPPSPGVGKRIRDIPIERSVPFHLAIHFREAEWKGKALILCGHGPWIEVASTDDRRLVTCSMCRARLARKSPSAVAMLRQGRARNMAEARLRVEVDSAEHEHKKAERIYGWRTTNRARPSVDWPEAHSCPACGHHVPGLARELGWAFSPSDEPRPKSEVMAEAEEGDRAVDEAWQRLSAARRALDEFLRAPEREREEAERRREERARLKREEYYRRHPTAKAEEDAALMNGLLRQIRRRLNEE